MEVDVQVTTGLPPFGASSARLAVTEPTGFPPAATPQEGLPAQTRVDGTCQFPFVLFARFLCCASESARPILSTEMAITTIATPAVVAIPTSSRLMPE